MAKKLTDEQKKLRVEMKEQKKETRLKKCLEDPKMVKSKDGSGKICRKPAFYGQKDRKKLLKKSRANCPDSIPIKEGELCVAKSVKPNRKLLEKGEKATKENIIKTAERRLDAEKEKRIAQGLVPWKPLKRNDKNVLSNSPTAMTMKGKGGKKLKNPKNKGVIVAYAVGKPDQLTANKKSVSFKKKALKRFRGDENDPLVQMSREIFIQSWENMSDGKKNDKWNLKDEYRGKGSLKKRTEFIRKSMEQFKAEVKNLKDNDIKTYEDIKDTRYVPKINEFRQKLGLPPLPPKS